jgi:cytochrome c oxidase cbb3-type subunit III
MRSFAAFLIAIPLLAQHGDDQEKKSPNPVLRDPVAIAAGGKLFTNSCAGCHGPRGEGGRGPNLRNRGAWHSLEDQDLFQTIQKGVPGADMPATNLPDDQIWQLAAFVKALSAPAIESKPPGDASVGEAIFWGKAGCGSCHRILGRGGMLGPDLSNIGALRPVDQIRESILDPDADGFRGYQGVTAITEEGRTISGVARSRTNYSIVVLDKSGNLHTLRTGGLRDVKFSQHSPMPSYKQRINAQQLTDLIAYLSRLSVRPYTDTTGKEPAGKKQ